MSFYKDKFEAVLKEFNDGLIDKKTAIRKCGEIEDLGFKLDPDTDTDSELLYWSASTVETIIHSDDK